MLPPNLNFKKTRIAPTPSGFLHLGNVLSFILTSYIAKATGAKIFLRIDGLDQARANPLYIHDIFDTLHFMEMGWDEGPRDVQSLEALWAQVGRMAIYEGALKQLADNGYVFACNCSRGQILAANSNGVYPGTCRHKNIPLDEPGCSWRLITDNRALNINTLTKGTIKTGLPPQMQDFIVRKKDGHPSYQLTSLMDDLHFNVDLIIRGYDLWPSTIAQTYLATLLNAEAFTSATFYHHPLMMAHDGRKLSKSAGDTSIYALRKAGESKQDIYALIAGMYKIKGKIDTAEGLAVYFLGDSFSGK